MYKSIMLAVVCCSFTACVKSIDQQPLSSNSRFQSNNVIVYHWKRLIETNINNEIDCQLSVSYNDNSFNRKGNIATVVERYIYTPNHIICAQEEDQEEEITRQYDCSNRSTMIIGWHTQSWSGEVHGDNFDGQWETVSTDTIADLEYSFICSI